MAEGPNNPRQPITHILIRLGLLGGMAGGLLTLLVFLATWWLGKNPWVHAAYNFLILNIGLVAMTIFLTLGYVRSVRRGGYLHLWEGLITGFMANLMLALTASILVYGYVRLVDPEILVDYKTKADKMYLQKQVYFLKTRRDSIKAENKKEYEKTYDEHFKEENVDRRIDQAIEDAKTKSEALKKTTAGDMWLEELLRKLILGAFIVPLASLILRKHPPTGP